MPIRAIAVLIALLVLLASGWWFVPSWWEEHRRRESLRPRSLGLAERPTGSVSPLATRQDLQDNHIEGGRLWADGQHFALVIRHADNARPVLVHGRRDPGTDRYRYLSRIEMEHPDRPWRIHEARRLLAFAGADGLWVHSLATGRLVAGFRVPGEADHFWFDEDGHLLVVVADLVWRCAIGGSPSVALIARLPQGSLGLNGPVPEEIHLPNQDVRLVGDQDTLIRVDRKIDRWVFLACDLANEESHRSIEWTLPRGYRRPEWTADGQAIYLLAEEGRNRPERCCRIWRLGFDGSVDSWELSDPTGVAIVDFAVVDRRLLLQFVRCARLAKNSIGCSGPMGVMAVDLSGPDLRVLWQRMYGRQGYQGSVRVVDGRWCDVTLSGGLIDRLALSDGSSTMQVLADPSRSGRQHTPWGTTRWDNSLVRVTQNPPGIESVVEEDESRQWFYPSPEGTGWEICGIFAGTVIGRRGDRVLGLDADDGTCLFRRRIPDLEAVVRLSGGIIATTTAGLHLLLDPISGQDRQRWQAESMRPVEVRGKRLITTDSGRIFAWEDDVQAWSWSPGPAVRSRRIGPCHILADGQTLVFTDDVTLRAVALDDGHDIAELALPLARPRTILEDGPALWVGNEQDEEVQVSLADWQLKGRRYVGDRGGDSAAIFQAVGLGEGLAVSYALGRWPGTRRLRRADRSRRYLEIAAFRSGCRIPDRPTGDLIHVHEGQPWLLGRRQLLYRAGERVGSLHVSAYASFHCDPAGDLLVMDPMSAFREPVRRLADGEWQDLSGWSEGIRNIIPWRDGLIGLAPGVDKGTTLLALNIWNGEGQRRVASLGYPSEICHGWVGPSGEALHFFDGSSDRDLVWVRLGLSADGFSRHEHRFPDLRAQQVLGCQFEIDDGSVVVHVVHEKDAAGRFLQLRPSGEWRWLSSGPRLFRIGPYSMASLEGPDGPWFCNPGPGYRSLQFRHRPSAALIGTLHIFQDLQWAFCTPQGRWDGSLAASDEHLMVAQEDAGYLPIGSVRPPEPGLMQQLLGLAQAEE